MRPARIDTALAAVAVGYAVLALARAPAWTVDDAFIVVRYAANAVDHGRLAMNLDGDRVEGFTSVVAMLIAVVAKAAGVDAIAATRACGAAAYVAIPLVVVRLARTLELPPGAGGAVAIVGAAMAEHATHALSGLETELFVLATLLGALAFAWSLRDVARSVVPLGLACTFAALVRPEGLACAAFLAIAIARRRFDRRALAAAGASFVLPLAVVVAARLAYFHDVVPNTFHAKSGGLGTLHLRSLVALTVDAFAAPAIACAAVVASARLAGSTTRALPDHARTVVLASLAVLGVNVLAHLRFVPVMDYGRRFAFHGLAYVIVAALAVIAIGVRAAQTAPARVLVALGVLAGASSGIARAPAEARRSAAYETMMRLRYVPAARWIEAQTPPDATIAVYPDAGLIPLETGRRTIDFGRLNDRFLARTDDPAAVAAYFFERAPDVLVATEQPDGALFDAGATAIVADPRFAARYRLATRVEGGGGALRIYEAIR